MPGPTSEPLQVRGRSVALTVNDLARSQTFYTDGLGFTVEEEMNGDDGSPPG